VRVLLLAMFGIAAVYGGTLPVYLFFRIRGAASALAHRTQAVVPLLEKLALRGAIVDRGRQAADRALERRAVLSHALLDTLTQLMDAGLPEATSPLPGVPPDLSREVARSDSALSQTARALAATVALIDDRRWSQATEQLHVVDSLDSVADRQGLLVASIGRRDLLERQEAVEAVTQEVLRDAVSWLVLGLLLLWLGVVVIRRRILRPLSALETGLARVAEGDLSTQVPVNGADELGQLGAHFNDMTQILLGRAEEQGRFTAAGQLLADVAHEVGNPLMAIAALAESRIGDATIPPAHRDEMQQILQQAQRAAKLLRGLLRFVRPSQRHVSTLSLNDVVRGALDVVAYRFGVDEITMDSRLDPGLAPVRGDAVALEQVVVNLLSNSIDALRTIKPPRTLTVTTWVAEGRVAVAVADNGPGVAPGLLSRLFRPFASTKGRRGAGLGLYISRQILRDAGGDLVLDVGEGAGARFVATLPAAPPAEPSPLGAVAQGAGAAARRLAGVRILLVDDEEAVRRPMAKFLNRRGAEVFEAGDGMQALALLATQAVDVILADLRMPRMSGMDLLTALERVRPRLAGRVLFLSGDVAQLGEPGAAAIPEERIFVKPVELAELERRIAEFLSAGRPA
jgi:signal transduction histidine kinase